LATALRPVAAKFFAGRRSSSTHARVKADRSPLMDPKQFIIASGTHGISFASPSWQGDWHGFAEQLRHHGTNLY
jgi:hypothetical protein